MIFTGYLRNLKLQASQHFATEYFINITNYEGSLSMIKQEKKLAPRLVDIWELYNNTISWKEFCYNYYNKLYNLPWTFWHNFPKNFDHKFLLDWNEDFKHSQRQALTNFIRWYFGKNFEIKEWNK